MIEGQQYRERSPRRYNSGPAYKILLPHYVASLSIITETTQGNNIMAES